LNDLELFSANLIQSQASATIVSFPFRVVSAEKSSLCEKRISAQQFFSMMFSRVEKGKILAKSISIIARFQIVTKSSMDWIVIDSLMWFRLFDRKVWR
jgi:hypothetical protein